MMRLCLLVVAMVTMVASVEEMRKAVALIQDRAVGQGRILGNVTFQQTGTGPVTVTGTIEHLTPNGKHGFHIHEKGDISVCTNAGAHFNPTKQNHGAPGDAVRHVGDLGNIDADATGVANFHLTDSIISLTGANSIVGRAVVVHEGVDDLGKGKSADSLTTGNAGARKGCGVIGIQ